MPNRMASFAVLFFSLAITLLAFQQPSGTPQHLLVPSVTLPILVYRILGLFATIAAVFFIVVAFFPESRRKTVEEWITNRPDTHWPGFIIFWSVYTIAYLKGVAAVITISPPVWVVYLVSYFGAALFLVLPALAFRKWFKTWFRK